MCTLAGEEDDNFKVHVATANVFGRVGALLLERDIFLAGLGSSRKNLHTDLELINNLSENDRLRLSRVLRSLRAGDRGTDANATRFEVIPQKGIYDVTRNWASHFDPNHHISAVESGTKSDLKISAFHICREISREYLSLVREVDVPARKRERLLNFAQ